MKERYILTANQCLSWAEIVEELTDGDYSFDLFNAIDSEIAERAVCPGCGSQMQYRGAERPGSRRAFAVCSGCDLASEF